MAKGNGKNGLIDIYKLLFAIVIMTGHSVNVGMKPPFPFAGVGIFVEFFYLLTGYFTCKHFMRTDNIKSQEWIIVSLKYTYYKMKKIFPYIVLSVSLRYTYDALAVLKSGGKGIQVLRCFFYAPFEMFLSNYLFAEVPQKVGALYFLAAMVIVLPMFAVLCLCGNNTIKLGVAILAVITYYHDVEGAITSTYPQVLARAFCGMCMGIIVFYLSEGFIFKLHLNVQKSFFLLLLGNLLLIVSMFLSGISHDNRRVQLLCIFFGVLFFVLIGESKFSNANMITNYMGTLSMVIYIMHWTFGVIINGLMKDFDLSQKMFVYYAVTILGCVVTIEIVEKIKHRINIIQDT